MTVIELILEVVDDPPHELIPLLLVVFSQVFANLHYHIVKALYSTVDV